MPAAAHLSSCTPRLLPPHAQRRREDQRPAQEDAKRTKEELARLKEQEKREKKARQKKNKLEQEAKAKGVCKRP